MNSGLRAYNEQNKLAQWVQIVSDCRDSRHECTAVVPGAWHQYLILLQMAEKSVCHGPRHSKKFNLQR